MDTFSKDRDYVDLEDESDQEGAISSDDDIDIALHGTPEQKRRLRRRSLGQASSSEDEFEKEMEKELNATVKKFEAQRTSSATDSVDMKGDNSSQSNSTTAIKKEEFYDDIYFDSDEDDVPENADDAAKNRKHKIVSNDDLLYDPNLDNEDQRWVDRQRRQYQPKDKRKSNTEKPTNRIQQKLPQSDAVLNCPACMSPLCMDCQRHDTYKNQYRAMFVSNCTINYSEKLSYPNKAEKRKKKNRNVSLDNSMTNPSLDSPTTNRTIDSIQIDCDYYHPVRCSACNTEVAVYDNNEIYHFFNVLASYA